MPLLALLGQLTSTRSSKSWNFRSVIIFEPADLFTRHPPSTTQLEALAGLSNRQPDRSCPLNSEIGSPGSKRAGALRMGARFPDHVHGTPSGPLAVPVNVFRARLPSKTRSVLLPSSSFGETK